MDKKKIPAKRVGIVSLKLIKEHSIQANKKLFDR